LTGTIANPLNPLLAPLRDYGGPTQTMALLPDSPAIGAGIAIAGITTDQRGVPRGSFVDIGALQSTLLVESAAGSVDTTLASLTLTGAVALANQNAGSTIRFDPAVFTSPQTITLTSPLDLTNTSATTTIAGPASGLTISGGGAVRVFQVKSGVA